MASAPETTLKGLREAAGYTQEKAAQRFEVSVRTWGAWERGETDAPRAVFDLLEIEAKERAEREAGAGKDTH